MATTTNYGWETPDDTDLVKDGALAQRTTASAIDTTLFGITGGKNVGLVPLYTTTVSGVTTVTISNIFSANYDNYRIMWDLSEGTLDSVYYRLRTGSTDATTNYLNNFFYIPGGGTIGYGTFNDKVWAGSSGSNTGTSVMDIISPFKTTYTKFTMINIGGQDGGNAYQFGSGGAIHRANTSYESLSIFSSAFTGTIKVYGYRNS